MRSWFLKRKYPEKLIDNEVKKVRFFPAKPHRLKSNIHVSVQGINPVVFLIYHRIII